MCSSDLAFAEHYGCTVYPTRVRHPKDKALVEYIGFTGVLTFKNAKKALKALAEVPEDKLVLETDCPYMAPVPFRGKRCDSRMIPYTAEAAALVRGTDTQTILEQTCRNGEALFGIRAAAASRR